MTKPTITQDLENLEKSHTKVGELNESLVKETVKRETLRQRFKSLLGIDECVINIAGLKFSHPGLNLGVAGAAFFGGLFIAGVGPAVVAAVVAGALGWFILKQTPRT